MDSRPRPIRTIVQPLLLALAVTAIATLVRFALDPVLGPLAPFVTYFLAVVLLAWTKGALPGSWAVIFSAVAGDFLFVRPRFAFGLGDREAILQTFLFIVVSGSIVAFSHVRLRQSQRIERLLEEVRLREQ